MSQRTTGTVETYEPVDYLVICALEIETKALYNTFFRSDSIFLPQPDEAEATLNAQQEAIFKQQEAIFKAQQKDIPKAQQDPDSGLLYRSGVVNGRHVVIMEAEKQGTLNAATLTSMAISLWKPSCVVSFGIAGRLQSEEDVALTDVVIANQVFYYEPRKETITDEGNFQMERNGATCPPTWEGFYNHPEIIRLMQNLKTKYIFNVHNGEVASGEAKIATPISEVRLFLKYMARNTLAIEMEAAGVIHVARKYHVPERMVIKGISDDAGADEADANRISGSNHATEREITRPTAAGNAALVLSDIIITRIWLQKFVNPNKNRNNTYLKAAQEFQKLISPALNMKATLSLSRYGQYGNYTSTSENNNSIEYSTPLIHSLFELFRRGKGPIPLFVTWTLRKDHIPIHWVDFYFLLAIRELTTRKRVGCIKIVVHLLISDVETLDDQDKNIAISVFRSILGNDCLITWLSEVQNQEHELSEYCAQEQVSIRGVVNDEEVLWARYIIERTRRVKRFMALVWDNDSQSSTKDKWNALYNSYSRDAVFLHRRTLMLGGKLGKDCPVPVEGPGYLALNESLKKLDECHRRSFADCFADILGNELFDQDLNDRCIQDGWEPELGVQMKRIYKLLQYWNDHVFSRAT